MKKATNKKMTIDDLAMMITEGREETNELARMVAKGFDGMNNELGEFKREVNKRFNETEKDLAEVKENLASTRRDVLSMGDRFTMKYEFHELASRVSVLEQKQKVKR